jgi:hypothetical protein
MFPDWIINSATGLDGVIRRRAENPDLRRYLLAAPQLSGLK